MEFVKWLAMVYSFFMLFSLILASLPLAHIANHKDVRYYFKDTEVHHMAINN